MFPSKAYLRKTLEQVLKSMQTQGYDILQAEWRLEQIPDSLDALITFAWEISRLPLRSEWHYVEPVLWDEIEAEMDSSRQQCLRQADPDLCSSKVEAAFLGSVLGCILGKPLEVNPELAELKAAGKACGQWPIRDFISEDFLAVLGRRHSSWTETTLGNIRYVAADDDLNYSVLGMLALEEQSGNITLDGMKRTWLRHQAMGFAFGPEQYITACVAVNRLMEEEHEPPHPDKDYRWWADLFNPMNEECGAVIRVDAYGYAFPGRPDLAVKCAAIDASFTHRHTGVYAAMYTAAVIAGMFTAKNPIEPFEEALKFIPQQSRFAQMCRIALQCVLTSESFEEGYDKIHYRFAEYGHCKIYQEIGTLMNTLRWAENIWDGVCKQVMQGNDTDSFGCTAGSMLGAYFGLDGLDQEKILVFQDQIHIALADFYETSLSKLAKRMGELPIRFLPKKGKE